MARRKTRPSMPADHPPRKTATVVSRAIHDAVTLERDRLRDALAALHTESKAEIDRLTARLAEVERDYAGTLNLRGEYERVVKERDEARAERDQAISAGDSFRRASRSDYDTIDRLRRQLDEANYRASCTLADAVTARKALAEQAIATAAVTRDLREARRSCAEMDRLNPRVNATLPARDAYDGALAASEHDADDI